VAGRAPGARSPQGKSGLVKAPRANAPAASPKMPDLDSLLAGIAAFIIYLLLAPHVSGDKDASEFTLVLATRGVAHPTGYPIYTILGSFFVRLVHALGGTWSFGANAWSAMGGAVSIGFFHALIARLLPAQASSAQRRWIPLVAIAILLLNPIWTVETTLAEVYSWHVAWACGISCVFVGALRKLASRKFTDKELSKRAALFGFLCGVGLAHHATAVFVIGPLSVGLVFALWRARRLKFAPLALGVLASFVALTADFWIMWRAYHPAGFMWPSLEGKPASILRHLTGGAYTMYLGWFNPSDLQKFFLNWYVYPFLFPGIALSGVAAWRAHAPEDRVARWTLMASAIAGTAYAFFYGVSDPSSYFLAPLLLALATSATLLDTKRVRAIAVAAAIIVAAAVLSVGWVGIGLERNREFVRFDGMVHDMWNSMPFDTGFVFWRNDMYVRLREYQLFAGEKPGLAVVHPANLTHEAGRMRFIRRYGFDPLAGLTLNLPAVEAPGRDEAINRYYDDIEHNVNRHSSLPVVHFDPSIPSVRLLKKTSVFDSLRVAPLDSTR
jgi:hypothetical protein